MEGTTALNVESGATSVPLVPHADDVEKATTTNESSCKSKICSYFDLGFVAGSTGTYFGFAILVGTIIGSIITQASPPQTSEKLIQEWLSGCPSGFEKSCMANQAVLRFSCALVVLYGLNVVMTLAGAHLYDAYWIPKTIFYGLILYWFFYVDAKNFNELGYAWFARIGGFFYIMLQQVILLDFALSWNESWLAKSKAESGLSKDGLDRWKIAILVTGVGLFVFSVTAIGIMFKYFGGCMPNDVVLSLGIVINVLGFIYQLTCTRIGSVLTSGVMAAYYAYICFSAVTLNPDASCNPSISRSPQTWTTAIGLAITVISLSWTCYSTVKSLPAQALTGVQVDDKVPYATPGLRGILLSVSAIFIMGSCYYAMVLTNWSTLQEDFSMARAQLGTTALWLQGSASWVCFLMYIWALTAPMIWPERFGVDPKLLR